MKKKQKNGFFFPLTRENGVPRFVGAFLSSTLLSSSRSSCQKFSPDLIFLHTHTHTQKTECTLLAPFIAFLCFSSSPHHHPLAFAFSIVLLFCFELSSIGMCSLVY
ncbi:hypothetical protein GOP47_0016035 [Adiantum capillus-veneris]|uniref:Transmembrane protein n=1 Tax=Adiantum capillus-veneris TaxID=13818 RepID=A0A9D4ULD9_ADICA|nr:hypothetical protein GOP47_0016035 [Adiantum capillus-veneris]